ncbi:hypothetical protein BBI11_13100 [Planococcus maritimus]|nr:glycosyltransferase family 2 protein [Planococcus maritimus]ANU17911.1 hypothetical protein BBI11_13100 [Planococcus maritimus]
MQNNLIPKISVIIPVFNTEKYLKTCINSVLNQEYDDFELILVNDGSSDGSGVICEEYSRTNSRVKTVHLSNGGAATARNVGIEKSKGEYIMFLDSDDFWIDGCLSEIAAKLSSHEEIDVMFLNYAIVKKDGSLTEFKGYKFDYLTRRDLLKYISLQNKVAVSACLKVINKKMFSEKKIYFKNGLLAEDIDWFFNLMRVADSFTTYNGDFYCYRILENSASRSISEKRIIDYLYILNTWVEIVNKEIDKEEQFYFYNMIGYEYEVLLATFFDYKKSVRVKYLSEIKSLIWILNYRKKPRSKMIKFLNKLVGFNNTCKILNYYLHNRKIN